METTKTGSFFHGRSLAAAVLAGVAALTMAASTARAVVTYSTSFESPAYTAGASVAGVDGWVAGSSSGASQTVSGTRASVGSQSLFFDNTGTNNSFYSVYHPLGSFSGAVTLTVDMYVPSTNGADRLGEVMFSTGTLGSCVLGLSIDGAGGIHMGKTWGSLYGTAVVATAPSGTFADRWLTATLTFTPGSATGSVTLSGFGGATPSYTSSYTAVTTPTNTNLGTDYITTAARTGSLYYDNLAINAAVPEPSTVAMSLCGAVALGAMVRRRQAA